ncbi:MAG: hypothetical protein H5U15_08845 [Roseovarius sp.]|nr:hypothetical protein [Roseovarius sp.]
MHVGERCYDLGRGPTPSFAGRGKKLPLVMRHEPVGQVIAAGPDAGDPQRERTFVIIPTARSSGGRF